MNVSKALSNVVVGLIVAIAVAGALSALIWWARQRALSIPQGVEEIPNIVVVKICRDVIIVNSYIRDLNLTLLTDVGGVCWEGIVRGNSTAIVRGCNASIAVVGRRLQVVKVVEQC